MQLNRNMDIKPTKIGWRNILSDKLVNSGIIADYFKANQFRYVIYVISYWKVILSLRLLSFYIVPRTTQTVSLA